MKKNIKKRVKKKEKKNLFISIIAIITIIMLIAGSTYAYWSWQTATNQQTNVRVTVQGATMTITGRGNYYGTLTINFTITPTWVKNVKQVAASTTDKEIKLTWDAVVGVTGYEVYRSTEKLGTYSLIGSTTTKEIVSKNLEAGKSYFYKVRAYKTVDGKRIYGNYSNILKATTRTVPPSKVMGAITMNTNNISWYYSPGAEGYEVYMSTASKFIGSKIETTTSAVRSVTIPGLTAGKTYYVRVRAYTTTAAGEKMYTSFSNYLAFKAR